MLPNILGIIFGIPVMDSGTLYEGYKMIMRHIYAPKQYYHRVRHFLAGFQPPKIKVPMDYQRLLALFRSVVCLEILGRERFQLWKLFLWLLTRRPKLFTLAITLAIYGHHFRKMCDLYIRIEQPMKTTRYAVVLMLLTAFASLPTGCAPYTQTDIAPSRVGSPNSNQVVLLASRDSAFKKVLVAIITKEVTADNMAVEIVGIEDLKTISAGNYTATVIISTCQWEEVDPLVRQFLDRHPDYEPVVLVITSDSGWLPEKKDLDVDAVSSASMPDDSDAVVRQVMALLVEKLNQN